MKQLFFVFVIMGIVFISGCQPKEDVSDPLPSWNDGATKEAIINFVTDVTTENSPDFVPAAERIATFDNDGTLWAEQPMYFQLYFILDRIKALSPQHPEWGDQEPFKSVLKGDIMGALAGGDAALIEMGMAAQTGMSSEEFNQIVGEWVATAKHPETGRLFTEMIYQPMLELLEYLRANDFKTYIVSGGGIAFMRPWSEKVYGIPPEQVIGSRGKTEYQIIDNNPVIMRLPEMEFIDDKKDKPIGINLHIGRRPILAFGNSDGDFQMLEWTTSGAGPRLGLIVHHTDEVREWAYDRESHIGHLANGLDEGPGRGWIIVDMKNDWSKVFPGE